MKATVRIDKALDTSATLGGCINVSTRLNPQMVSGVASWNGETGDVTYTPPVTSVNGQTGDVVLSADVASVNGKTGDVVLNASDVGALPDSYAAPVSSVNSKTGAVTLSASDVGALPDSTPIPTVPTDVSAFNNDAQYVNASQAAAAAPVQSVNGSTGAVTVSVPTKVSQLSNDSGFITGINSGDVTTALGYTPYNATNPNGYVNASGAASAAPVQSVNGQTGTVTLSIPTVPTNVSSFNNDAGYITGMFLASYGSSTYADVLTAYQAKKVVYCRASSEANPSSGAQKRLAFLAYVSDATTPTEFEFQYYRSVSSHSDSQQGDQVYVYKLNKSAGWSVTVRESYSKIVPSTGLTKSYSNGALTFRVTNPMPAVTGSDNGKVLMVSNGAWSAQNLPVYYDFDVRLTAADGGEEWAQWSSNITNSMMTNIIAMGDTGNLPELKLTIYANGEYFKAFVLSERYYNNEYQGTKTFEVSFAVCPFHTILDSNESVSFYSVTLSGLVNTMGATLKIEQSGNNTPVLTITEWGNSGN